MDIKMIIETMKLIIAPAIITGFAITWGVVIGVGVLFLKGKDVLTGDLRPTH